MRLIETYANNSSVEIKHKPSLVEKFFPLGGIDKYITLQTKSGMPAKDYSFFQEVIGLIVPILEKENIKILHLGQDCQPLNGVTNLIGQTSISQAAYLLKRSLLHFGADSWMAHYCGAEEIPLVSLYGNTTVANHSPYFYNKDKTIFLESHRNGQKASFAREENPKTIDLIWPEQVAKSVLQLLNLEFSYPYKTLQIGSEYKNRIIESANDCLIDVSKLGLQNLIIRNDYNYNLDNLFKQIQFIKSTIVTEKELPIEPLQQLRPNIIEVLFKVTKENNNPKFIKNLQQAKIPCRLFSYLSEEELNPLKLDYLDAPSIIHRKESKTPEILKGKDFNNIFYKSSKFILGRGKIYSSLFDYKSDRPIPNFEPTPVQLLDINLDELFMDSEYVYLLEKI